MTSLYNITADIRQRLDNIIEVEELSDSDLMDILGSIKEDAREKHLAIAAYILELECEAGEMENYVKRMELRAKRLVVKINRLREALLASMNALEIFKYKSIELDIAIKDNPGRAIPVNENLTPKEFKRQVIIDETPDKAKIRDALKNGQAVPGWTLFIDKSLKIKSN